MKRILLLSIMMFALSGSAWAQTTIDKIFKNGPIVVHIESDLSISQFGPQSDKVGVVSGDALIVLRRALAIINSVRDDINAYLTCDNKKLSYSASITEFTTESDDKSLTLSAHTYISQCSRGPLGTLKGLAENVHGNIIISVIIEPFVSSSGIVQLKPPRVSFRNSDVSAAYGFYKVTQKDIDNSTQEVGPELKRYVSLLNAALVIAFSNPAIQSKVKAYNLRLEKVQLVARGEDLAVKFHPSGQFTFPDFSHPLSW